MNSTRLKHQQDLELLCIDIVVLVRYELRFEAISLLYIRSYAFDT